MKNLGLYDENLSVPRKEDVDSKQDKILVDGIIKSDGDGNITALEMVDATATVLDKNAVGLGNVDNTSDVDKPVSTAQKAAIDAVENGVKNGTIIAAKATGDASGNNIENTYATKEELQSLSSVQIQNKNEVISATQATVQTVATQYIVTNYSRQPKNWDGLILTITDLDNDKILYIYSEVSSLWINAGINGVDLDAYVGTFTQSFTDTQKQQARTNIGAASTSDVAAKQDILLASGASVGDLIKVAAVDANGKPTAWAVCVPGTDYMATGNITKQTLVASETTPTGNYAINWHYE